MTTQLKNVIRFLAVPIGVPTSLPHGLNIDDRGVVPDFLGAVGAFAVAADDTDITVTNNGAAPANIDVIAEHWHTLERVFGPAAATDLVPQPFALVASPPGGAAASLQWNLVGPVVAATPAAIGDLVMCDPTAGAFPVTLPAIAAGNGGFSLRIKNVTNSLTAITITPAGADTIDGAPSLVISTARGEVELVSNGVSDWMVH